MICLIHLTARWGRGASHRSCRGSRSGSISDRPQIRVRSTGGSGNRERRPRGRGPQPHVVGGGGAAGVGLEDGHVAVAAHDGVAARDGAGDARHVGGQRARHRDGS